MEIPWYHLLHHSITANLARPSPARQATLVALCRFSFMVIISQGPTYRQPASDQAARAGCATHLALVGVSSDHHDTSCGLPAPPGDAHNAKVHSRHLVTYYIAFPDQRKFVCPVSVCSMFGEKKPPTRMARGSVPRCMVSGGGCCDRCPAFFIYWLIDVAVGMGTQLFKFKTCRFHGIVHAPKPLPCQWGKAEHLDSPSRRQQPLRLLLQPAQPASVSAPVLESPAPLSRR
jgi:hypothetical protein